MRSLYVTNEQIKHLLVLDGKDDETIHSWTKAAGNSLRTGLNPKIFSAAASRLNIEVSDVRNATECMMSLLTQAAKLNLSPDDLRACLSSQPDLPSTGVFVGSLTSVYESIVFHLSEVLSTQHQPFYPLYKDVRWRLDAQVDSSYVRNQVDPHMTLRLSLTNQESLENNQSTSECTSEFRCSPNTLRYMIGSLDRAVQQSRARHLQRVKRTVEHTKR